jgi:hypothetical protein
LGQPVGDALILGVTTLLCVVCVVQPSLCDR